MWDLIWLVGFGLVPGIAGMLFLRQPPSGPRRVKATSSIPLLALATSGLAAWSLRPPADQRFTIVVFAPWIDGSEAIAAIGQADARLVWTDPDLGAMVVDVPAERQLGLYAKGALLVTGGALAAGCIDWSRPIA